MSHQMTKAFSLVSVLFIMLLISTLFIAIFNLSGKIIQETSTQYRQQQAILLAHSYKSYAIMAVMSNNRRKTKHCISDISAIVGGEKSNSYPYYIQVHMSFIGEEKEIKHCFKSRQLAFVSHPTLHVLIDVYVRYKDITHPLYNKNKPSTTPWINYHTRSIEKI